jgi:hypothetical protein
MKILKKTDTSNWSYKYICDKCDTEMEVEKKDLVHKWVEGDRMEPGYDSFSFYCPVCMEKVNIHADKLPKLVQIEVKNKLPTGLPEHIFGR